jgi:hypothetical protein
MVAILVSSDVSQDGKHSGHLDSWRWHFEYGKMWRTNDNATACEVSLKDIGLSEGSGDQKHVSPLILALC